MLAETAYGKSNVRLVKLSRRGDRHDLKDLTIAIRFEGDYDQSYTDGDNSGVLPTDTMKNTVYALAAREAVDEPEAFGLTLARHFLGRNPRLARVRVDLTEHPWGRIVVGNREHGQAFVRQGGESRTATVHGDRTKLTVAAGITDLVVLKSSQSAFAGFLRDEYTTLAETEDRLLATSLSATWWYRDLDVEFGQAWRAVRQTLLETFAEHDSKSVQHTLHAMGQAVLDSIADVTSIRLVMPNKHHLPFDLTRVGLQNRNEIFVPADEPFGLIEATLVR
ncbi:MAG TPA: urate oxidase [Vicinamibacterales bacterium]|nr:urate oxidase [Vicinamibacterales bacterium]